MAICKFCQQEMLAVDYCPIAYDADKRRMRIPFGQEKNPGAQKPEAPDERCHDCGVTPGHYHHPGCDVDECAACGDQRFICGCIPGLKWQCPACKANLEEVGVADVLSGVTKWTTWNYVAGRWDIGEEETGDDGVWSLECRKCQATLPDDLSQALWEEVEQSWAGRAS